MKASELIYRLARAIEERGDLPVTIVIEDANGITHDSIDVKCLDVNTAADYFELFGEDK